MTEYDFSKVGTRIKSLSESSEPRTSENNAAESSASSYKWEEIKQHSLKSKARAFNRNIAIKSSPYIALLKESRDKKLRDAASTNNLDLVNLLLASGADPNSYDEHKRCALHLAACCGYKDIIRTLLKHGANPNNKDTMGNTPLHLAVCTNHIPVIVDLLDAGTNVASMNKHGKNPLQLAQSKLKLIQLQILRRGVSNAAPDTEKLKAEIKTIVLMMLEYMHVQKVNTSDITALELQMESLSTNEQVSNGVAVLLQNFDNLNLS